MAGVTADLELETSQTLRAIAEVEAELNRAFTGVGDTLARDIRDEIRSLQGVVVDIGADTTGLAGEVTSALDAADTSVAVDADVSGDVAVAADRVEDIGEAADETERQIGGMESSLRRAAAAVVALVAGRELLDFLNDSAQAASSLAEQISGTDVVFGQFQTGVQEAAGTADVSMGLAEDQFLSTANSLGALLTAMGVTREEASRLGPEIIQRAADVASLRDVAGGTAEVLEAFQSGIVGEAEPLRRFGVVINEAAVQAKAMQLGLGDATGELTEQEKVLARLELIMEGTTIAQGNFALTSDGLANSQRILSAEWRNAQIEIGNALLPTVLSLVGVAREELIPTIERLGVTLVPLLARAFEAASPLIGSAFDILDASLPILEVFVSAIEAIPDEILGFVGVLAVLRGALGPLPGLFANVVARISAGGGLAAAFSGLTNPITLVAIGLGVAVTAISAFNREAEEQKRRIDEVRDAFLANTEAIESTADVQVRQHLEAQEQIDDLTKIGVSISQVADLARQGEPGLRTFIERLLETGQIEFDPAVVDNLDDYLNELEANSDSARALTTGNEGLVVSFLKLREELQAGAEESLDTLVATEALSQAQVDAAVAANTAADGTVDYVGALEQLEGKSRTTGDEIEETNRKIAQLPPTLDEINIALGVARGSFEGISGATLALGGFTDGLIGILSRGGLEADDYRRLMENTGLSLEQLIAIEDEVAAAVQATTDTILGNIPRIAGAFDDLDPEGPQGLNAFLGAAEDRLAATSKFLDNIGDLIARGAGDLAGAFLEAGVEEAAKAAEQASNLGDRALADQERKYDDLKAAEDLRLAQAEQFGHDLTEIHDKSLRDLEAVAPPDLTPQAQEALDGLLATLDSGKDDITLKGIDIGRQFSGGLGLGMMIGREDAVQAARIIAGEVIVVVRNGLQIESPSKVMMELGRQAALGLALGLSEKDAVTAASEALWMSVVPNTQVVPAFASTASGVRSFDDPGGAGGWPSIRADAVVGTAVFQQPVEPMHFFAEAEGRYVEGANR